MLKITAPVSDATLESLNAALTGMAFFPGTTYAPTGNVAVDKASNPVNVAAKGVKDGASYIYDAATGEISNIEDAVFADVTTSVQKIALYGGLTLIGALVLKRIVS